MDIETEELRKNILKRNAIIEVLKRCSKDLKGWQKELDNIDIDPCHLNALPGIKERYRFAMKDIDSIIQIMEHGDWCLSCDSTRQKEKEMIGNV